MRSLILVILLMSSLGFAQAQETPPDLDGYVTSVTSKTDFAVDGIRVSCVAKTRYRTASGPTGTEIPWTTGPYIGQPLKLFGKMDHKAHTPIAKEIALQYESNSAKAGSGVIDRILSADNSHRNQIVVRADGYPILINGKTNISFTPPLVSLSDVTTNVWIEFKGEHQPGGLIVAAHAVFTKNAVGGAEGFNPVTAYLLQKIYCARGGFTPAVDHHLFTAHPVTRLIRSLPAFRTNCLRGV
jgi:hypothetical protein